MIPRGGLPLLGRVRLVAGPPGCLLLHLREQLRLVALAGRRRLLALRARLGRQRVDAVKRGARDDGRAETLTNVTRCFGMSHRKRDG